MCVIFFLQIEWRFGKPFFLGPIFFKKYLVRLDTCGKDTVSVSKSMIVFQMERWEWFSNILSVVAFKMNIVSVWI